MLKRITVLIIILLLNSVNVLSRENSRQKSSEEVLSESAEGYFNKICSFDRIFLNIAAKKISQPDNIYIPLDKDVPVRLELNKELMIYIDLTYIENPVIYITSGYFLILENEAELAGKIAHELGHLASLDDRKNPVNTDEDYLKSELAADRTAIFVLGEMGYKPEAISDVLARILYKHSDETDWPKKVLVHRFLAAKKLAEEIYNSENKDYKEYLYFSQRKFQSIKTIVKYLQNKQENKEEKSGKESALYFFKRR